MLRLVDRLPRHSHYKAAIADDDELARQVLEHLGRGTVPARPPLTEYSTLIEVLSNFLDELRELHATLIAVNSAKGRRPRVTRTPRPETAVMRAEKRRSMERLMELEQRLLGAPPSDQ